MEAAMTYDVFEVETQRAREGRGAGDAGNARREEVEIAHAVSAKVASEPIGQFWLFTGPRTYNPIVRQVALARDMDVVDCAPEAMD
jgi:hypothetical protein